MKRILNNEEGFTFLEALISLVISSLIMVLLSSGILQSSKIKDELIDDSQNFNEDTNVVTGDRQIEWHLFLNQLETYLAGSIRPQVTKNIIVVDEWDAEEGKYSQVLYQRPDSVRSVFIRRKNGGNQRLLTGIFTIEFKLEADGWLLIENKFRNGEVYQGRLWIESWTQDI